MLKGIDISSWQTGIDLSVTMRDLDFCIVKATEGTAFVETTCDPWIQQLIKLKKLWGFYHFARTNEPEDEASYFVKACKNYFGHGIPVLDTETGQSGEWCQRFVDRVHALTGVWTIVYMSSNTKQRAKFIGTSIPKTCGLWEAFYPDARAIDFDHIPPYEGGCAPWEFAALWQFSAYGNLNGFDGAIDLDVAWMDAAAWQRYARPDTVAPNPEPKPEPELRKWTFENNFVRVTVELKK